MIGQVAILRAAPGATLRDELGGWLAGAAAPAGTGPALVVLAAGDEGAVPEEALIELLSGPLGIGAVVPLLYGAAGQVLEAGSFVGPTGAVEPFGSHMGVGSRELAFRRDVPGSASTVVAVAARALEGFTTDAVDAPTIVREVVRYVRDQGWRAVYEPTWRVPAPEGFLPAPAPVGPRRWAERDEGAPVRVLVVTGTIPGTLAGAEGLAEVVEVLARCPATRVTLACADGFGADRYGAYYQRQGVEVAAGPLDWLEWCADRRYHYSHVLVSDEGLTTRLWPMARSSQPQALAGLYSERLPFRRSQALGDASWHVEGTETIREVHQGRLLRQLEGIEMAWCASDADANLLAGLRPGLVVTRLGPPLLPPGPGKGFADREGVALVATDSFDAAGDPEAPALRALEELVPAWRRRDMSLKVTVVSDWPTPGLAHMATAAGAEIVPSRGDLVGALRTARLVVAPVVHGTSASAWVPAALAAGTPWLCTPKAVAGTYLEAVDERAVVADVATMGHRGWALLTDERAWDDVASGLGPRLADLRAQRLAALTGALLGAGIDPPRGALWPVERRSAHPSRPPVQVALRPSAVADPPAIFVADSLSEDERYELWHQRRGPNTEVVAAIGAEAARAGYQPTISVLMPVCDTAAWMLEAAVQSVMDQAYANWQLCLADDASERAETLAKLASLVERDSRVSLVRLPRRSGISAATNAALSLATGEYVGFLDHDDILKPHALAQVVRWLDADPALDLLYSDEDKLDPAGRFTEARWKPDFSPNLLLCQNYVCHFLVVRRSLVERLGGLRPEYDGSQDYDLVLRVTEATDHVAHIPDSLYSWRMHEQSAASAGDNKPWAWMAAQRALGDWLRRRESRGGAGGWTEEGAWFDVHRVRFRRAGEPKVSIIIPTRNGRHLLGRCVESVISKSVYSNFELVVVDNQSDDPDTLEYLATLPGQVLRYPHEFNYPRQLNLAVAAVDCDVLVFLNNDTEVLTTDWLDRLVEQAMRPEVGAVGPACSSRTARCSTKASSSAPGGGTPTRSSGATGGGWETCSGTFPPSRAPAWRPGRACTGGWAATMNVFGWLTTTSISAYVCTKPGTRWFMSLMPRSFTPKDRLAGWSKIPRMRPCSTSAGGRARPATPITTPT